MVIQSAWSDSAARLRPPCRNCTASVWVPNPDCLYHDVRRWFAFEARLRVADTMAENRHLADRFLVDCRRICGEAFFAEASPEEDRDQATDLVSLWLPQRRLRIACRVRRWKYLEKYLRDFTLRTVGRQSELQKLAAGWGDFLLYALLASDEATIDRWWMGDLRVWRRWFRAEMERRRRERAWPVDPQARVEQSRASLGGALSIDPVPGELSWDGRFRIFHLEELPPDFIWKTSAPHDDAPTGDMFGAGRTPA